VLQLSEEMKIKMKHLNEHLLATQAEALNVGREDLRDILREGIGPFRPTRTLTKEEVGRKFPGAILGVDGSNNGYGGSFPHEVAVLQAAAIMTTGETYLKADVVAPLLPEARERVEEIARHDGLTHEQAMDRLVKMTGAELEIQVALSALEEQTPALVLLDGGLLRYRTLAPSWGTLREKVLRRNIPIAGVIEEIGTREIARSVRLPGALGELYDRGVLYGLLEPGEALWPLPTLQWKQDIYTVFARLSHDPHPVGIDLLREQEARFQDIVQIIYTLTPSGGRGIPLWLDVVDERTRLSSAAVELIVETFIDPAVRQKLLIPKRDRRDF